MKKLTKPKKKSICPIEPQRSCELVVAFTGDWATEKLERFDGLKATGGVVLLANSRGSGVQGLTATIPRPTDINWREAAANCGILADVWDTTPFDAPHETLSVTISGESGTGKTALAYFIKSTLERQFDIPCAVTDDPLAANNDHEYQSLKTCRAKLEGLKKKLVVEVHTALRRRRSPGAV